MPACSPKLELYSKILGHIHICDGLLLLIYDVVTNYTANISVSISFAFLFIICGGLSYTSARGNDRYSLKFLIFLSILAIGSSIYLFVTCGTVLKEECLEKSESCSKEREVSQWYFFVVGIIELLCAMCNLILCYYLLKRGSIHDGISYEQFLTEPVASTITIPLKNSHSLGDEFEEFDDAQEGADNGFPKNI